jgi:hypothetical protein
MSVRLASLLRLLSAASLAALAACGGDGGAVSPDAPPGSTATVTIDGLTAGAVLGGKQHTSVSVAGDVEVVRVELYLDGDRIGEAPFAPWAIDWTTVGFPEGKRDLRAVAYLIDGTRVEGAIDVVFDNTPPFFTGLGAAVTGQPLAVQVGDNVGVASVQVTVDGQALAATPTADGFAVAWSHACGADHVDVVITDLAGWTTTATAQVSTSDPRDADCDGYFSIAAGGNDCNDDDPNIHPGAPDSAYGTVDTNCDGVPGVDADGDGQASTASGGTDCNDLDKTIYRRWLTWSGAPLTDGAGTPITWTRGNAAMIYDGGGLLAVNRGGAIELVSIADSGAITTAPLATGDDGPIALTRTATQYVLVYPKGTALRARRWTRGADPSAGVTDEVVFTGAAAVTEPHATLADSDVIVAARSGSSIWAAQLDAGTWTAGEVLTNLAPSTGPISLDGSTLAYQNTDGAGAAVYRATVWASGGKMLASPERLITLSSVDGVLFSSPNAYFVASGGALGKIARNPYYYDWTWSATYALAQQAIDRVVYDGEWHAMVVGHDAAGAKTVWRVNLDSGNAPKLHASLPDVDVAAPIDHLGLWMAAVPGTYYKVTGGTPDPIDGVDRDCDGED